MPSCEHSPSRPGVLALARTLALCASLALAATGAPAQGMAVMDRTAIANLVRQVGYWQDQLRGMQDQLTQMQQTHASLNGGRGMEGVMPLSNAQRNYLPPDYQQLMQAAQGGASGYAGLSNHVQAAMNADAVLTPAQLAAMTPTERQLVEDGRRSAALLSSASQSAYETTSQRFAALQELINRIGQASDPKAILDLQGRIGAEQTMLTNEQTKLQTLNQIFLARQMAQQQRIREEIIRGHSPSGRTFGPTLSTGAP